jgi:signal transduction histidine kinase
MSPGVAWVVALAGTSAAGLTMIELRRRAELVARACHEVRGPLAAASLALHAAQREAIGLELRRAGLALDDLQAAQRGRRVSAGCEAVDVGRLVAVQADTWRAVAGAHGRELRLMGWRPGDGAVVRGNSVRLAQAISNLVGNAVEHGGGRVEIALRASGGVVRVEVGDEGAGLPASVAALVAAGPSGRRGRGLSIAKEIAREHGGRLAGAPAAGGARLILELPAAAALHPLELPSREPC